MAIRPTTPTIVFDLHFQLSQADNPPTTSYVDAAGVLYDATIPYDIRFFESLDRVIQYEPWLERDRALIDTLRTLGIEKGKPFAPDAEMVRALNAAAQQAQAYLEGKYEKMVTTGPFAPGSSWSFPESMGLVFQAAQAQFAEPNVYPVEDRGLLLSFIFFLPKRMGEGQFYLMAIEDKDGNMLDGGKTCPLSIRSKPVGFVFFSSVEKDTYSNVHVEFFEQIAAKLAIIVEKGRLYTELAGQKQAIEKQNTEMMHELEMARRVQQALIPQAAPSIAGLEIALAYEPVIQVMGVVKGRQGGRSMNWAISQSDRFSTTLGRPRGQSVDSTPSDTAEHGAQSPFPETQPRRPCRRRSERGYVGGSWKHVKLGGYPETPYPSRDVTSRVVGCNRSRVGADGGRWITAGVQLRPQF